MGLKYQNWSDQCCDKVSLTQSQLTLEVTRAENRPKCTCLCCNNVHLHHTKLTRENFVSLDSWQIFLGRVYFSLRRFGDRFFAVEFTKHVIQLLPIFGRFYYVLMNECMHQFIKSTPPYMQYQKKALWVANLPKINHRMCWKYQHWNDHCCDKVSLTQCLLCVSQTSACYFPDEGASWAFGPFTVKTVSVETINTDVTIRNLTVTYNKKVSCQVTNTSGNLFIHIFQANNLQEWTPTGEVISWKCVFYSYDYWTFPRISSAFCL